jgi:hypothetical protein
VVAAAVSFPEGGKGAAVAEPGEGVERPVVAGLVGGGDSLPVPVGHELLGRDEGQAAQAAGPDPSPERCDLAGGVVLRAPQEP